MIKISLEAARSALQPSCGFGRVRLGGFLQDRLNRLRILGLRPTRLVEWLAVVEEELKEIGFHEIWDMIRGAIFRKVDKRVWRQRQAACYRCPVFDKTLKRCRPYTGAPVGCGCYTPYRLMSPDPCLRELSHRASSSKS
jgi:hypothetical protein